MKITLQSSISANKNKTNALIIAFVVFVISIGWLFGELMGNSSIGIVIATIISIVMALVGYYKGDAMALASSQAQPIKNAYPELQSRVAELAHIANLPTPRLFIINDDAPNAFATGRNPENASLAFTTGIIKHLTQEELDGVIAHELSHVQNYDIRIMTIVIVLVGIVALLSDWILHSLLWGDSDNKNGITLLFAFAIAILAPITGQLIRLMISRKREFLADASAVQMTKNPKGLASALQKISRMGRRLKTANNATAHLFISNPFGRLSNVQALFSTHPPIEERIKALLTY